MLALHSNTEAGVKNSRIYFYFYETKGRGAKGYSRPPTLKSRGAKMPLAPVESAPMGATAFQCKTRALNVMCALLGFKIARTFALLSLNIGQTCALFSAKYMPWMLRALFWLTVAEKNVETPSHSHRQSSIF